MTPQPTPTAADPFQEIPEADLLEQHTPIPDTDDDYPYQTTQP